MPKRPTFDEYFLNIAAVVASRSSCERSKVGAVLVKDRRIRGTGYNDSPAGQPGCETCPRRLSGCEPGSSYDTGVGACVALHAEQNVLLHTDRADLVDATLYVSREPCVGCWKMINGAGIARIVFPGEVVFRAAGKPLT